MVTISLEAQSQNQSTHVTKMMLTYLVLPECCLDDLGLHVVVLRLLGGLATLFARLLLLPRRFLRAESRLPRTHAQPKFTYVERIEQGWSRII